MSELFVSGFIENEISKDDFIKAIHQYNAHFAAPLTRIVSPDDIGCQPVIYDENEMYKTGNFFIDTIIRNVDKYSKDNNMRIVALSKQIIYAREPTLSEARISFRQMAENLNEEKLETYRYKKGSIQEGMLLRDIDDKIYDFPFNYRWVKSVFITVVSAIKSNDNEISIMDNLLNTIDAVSQKTYSNKSNSDYKLIHAQYTHVEVGPNKGYYCPISDSDTRCGCMSIFNLENIQDFFNKDKIPKTCATDGYYESIFYEELKGFDNLNVKPHKQFTPDPLKIRKKMN